MPARMGTVALRSDVAALSLFHYNELAAGGLRRDVPAIRWRVNPPEAQR